MAQYDILHVNFKSCHFELHILSCPVGQSSQNHLFHLRLLSYTYYEVILSMPFSTVDFGNSEMLLVRQDNSYVILSFWKF